MATKYPGSQPRIEADGRGPAASERTSPRVAPPEKAEILTARPRRRAAAHSRRNRAMDSALRPADGYSCGSRFAVKKLLAVVAMVLTWTACAWAGQTGTLNSLRSIRALSNADADRALPVAFEATVTYFRSYEATLFVQDEGEAIYVMATAPVALAPGDRVLIKGTTQPSFRPIVSSGDITVLRHGPLPPPLRASYGPMIQGQTDCMYVTARGVVRSAGITLSSGRRVTQLELVMDGGDAGVTIDSGDPSALTGLLDAEVE